MIYFFSRQCIFLRSPVSHITTDILSSEGNSLDTYVPFLQYRNQPLFENLKKDCCVHGITLGTFNVGQNIIIEMHYHKKIDARWGE